MSSVAMNVNGPQSARPAQLSPPSGGGGAGLIGGSTVDPVKLVMRNKWALAGATIGGIVLGVVAHFGFLYIYPIYKPRALFECNQPVSDPYKPTGAAGTVSQEEVMTFMQTAVRIMTSDEVLDRVANNPKLELEAPHWIKAFKNRDGTYDTNAIFKQLLWDVKAKTVPQTRLIELSFGWTHPDDAAAIVGLVMKEYVYLVKTRSDLEFQEQTAALKRGIDESTQEIGNLQNRRKVMIREKGIDSTDPRLSDATMRLDLLTRQRSLLNSQLEDIRTRIQIREEQLSGKGAGGAVLFPEEIKAKASRDPQIMDIQQQITVWESLLDGLRRNGISPEHRQYKVAQAKLESFRQSLEQAQELLWAREFNSDLEILKQQQSSYMNQLNLLELERKETMLKSTEITQVVGELNDIDEKIKALEFQMNSSKEKLKEFNSIQAMPTAVRIRSLQQNIRVPKEPIFPRLVFMVPAGAILGLGLVGGFIVLREVVDQRVKGPSDITVLPRTRLLGWVADAGEDPAGPGVVETAFRDGPRGVIAENFRQIRSTLLKRLDVAGHKTVLIAGCMPSSGSTSIASNLALAFAASGRSVLVIDANFRRPALHRVFGISEGPGLGDVLSGAARLDTAAQSVTGVPNLKVLTAGSKSSRVYEALAAESMAALLGDVRTKYDVVLVDVAPAVVSGDAATLATKTDASVLVARAFSDTRGMVARIKNELSEARGEFMGVIVNGVKSSAGGYLKGNIKATSEYHDDAPAPTA